MDGTWQTNFLGPFLLTELLGRLRQKQQHSPVRLLFCQKRLELAQGGACVQSPGEAL